MTDTDTLTADGLEAALALAQNYLGFIYDEVFKLGGEEREAFSVFNEALHKAFAAARRELARMREAERLCAGCDSPLAKCDAWASKGQPAIKCCPDCSHGREPKPSPLLEAIRAAREALDRIEMRSGAPCEDYDEISLALSELESHLKGAGR